MEPTRQPKPLWPIIVGGLFLLLAFVMVARLLTAFSPAAAPEDLARIEERTQAREALEAENKAKLETYAWVDKAKGSVQIPIDEAMKLTVEELRKHPPTAAGPVNPPAPATDAPATPAAPAEETAAETAAPAEVPASAATPAPAP